VSFAGNTTADERAQIAGLLAMGVPFDDVLDRFQLIGDNSSVSRLHFSISYTARSHLLLDTPTTTA